MESILKGIGKAVKPFSLKDLIFSPPATDQAKNKPLPMAIDKSILMVGEAGTGKISIFCKQVAKEAIKRPIYMVVVTRSAHKWQSIKNVDMRVFEDEPEGLASYQDEFEKAMAMAKCAKQNNMDVIFVLDDSHAAMTQLIYYKNMVESEGMKFVAMRQELHAQWKDIPLIQSFSAIVMFRCKMQATLDCLVKAKPTVSDTHILDIRSHEPGQYFLLE